MPPPMMAARRRPTTHHLLEWRILLACWVVLRWEPLFLGIPILFLHTGITLSFLTRWVILQYTSCRSSLPLLFFAEWQSCLEQACWVTLSSSGDERRKQR